MSEDTKYGGEKALESPELEPSELEDEVQIPSEDEETRDNLSRRKKAELARRDEIGEMTKRLEALEQKETLKKELDDMTENLELGKKSDSFKTEYQSLIKDGLSKEKAKEIAIKLVGGESKGKERATLPPTGTATADKSLYTEAQIEKLASTNQKEYARIMNLRDAGKVQIR